MAIDILESKVVGTNKETWYKLIGTKDDTKPTGEFPAGTGHTVAKDSTYFEIGTQIRYEFDGSVWNPKGQVPVTLIEKEITQNGVYSASDDDADGYSSATVNVPQENNAKFELTASNPNRFASVTQNLISIDVPSEATVIGSNAFSGCLNLKTINLPDGLQSIFSNSFKGCASLTSISIPSSVIEISADGTVFSGCTNLTSIVVHKAEGSIPNAPWGAPNATVIWTG